jgi:GntR family transcriptional regulator
MKDKQHITVDNSYMLLYTVYERRKNLLQKVLISALRRRKTPGKETDMQIVINGSSMVPVYEQLMDNIKQQIISGELKEGDALPSVRKLANELKISALTVKKSYDRLEEEGFVVTVHGKGSFVAGTDMALAVEARKKSIEEEFTVSVERARALGLNDDDIREILEIILGE